MSSQPHGGGVMRMWVAYISYERDLGSQILGVRASTEAGKKLACSHWEHAWSGDGDAPPLSWAEFEGHDGKGLQSVQSNGTYYLEEVELEVILPGDTREGEIGYLDLQVLRLTIETGRLASKILQQDDLIKTLRQQLQRGQHD